VSFADIDCRITITIVFNSFLETVCFPVLKFSTRENLANKLSLVEKGSKLQGDILLQTDSVINRLCYF
jgi:hypothetical protein